MKKLCCLSVLALATVIGVAAVVPTLAHADAPAGHHEVRFIEFVVGPFEHECHARERAEELRDRGFHTEVFWGRDHGWNVRAWKHE